MCSAPGSTQCLEYCFKSGVESGRQQVIIAYLHVTVHETIFFFFCIAKGPFSSHRFLDNQILEDIMNRTGLEEFM